MSLMRNSEVVKVGQKVNVTVIEVDLARNRISLSMKANPDFEQRKPGAPGERRQPSRNQSRRPQQASQAPSNDWFSMAMKNAKKK